VWSSLWASPPGAACGGHDVPAGLNISLGLFTALALLLFVVAVRAYLHSRSQRVLLLASAFALFLAKGLLLTIAIFRDAEWERLVVPGLFLDAAALALLYVAVLRKA
jgi:hypothetical protein